MLVVDTSALVAVLLDDQPSDALVDRLSDGDFHAPHLLDVEFTHAVRRLVAAGHLAVERAGRARADFSSLAIVRYAHWPFLDRMWEMRANLTAYDAAFVALSEALDVPLVTTDGRLAASAGHRATIEAY